MCTALLVLLAACASEPLTPHSLQSGMQAEARVTKRTDGPSQSRVVPAFPGAEGWGAGAVGGRGGEVYLVTTLADSGEGSLRACVDASGPRTCVFRVAGYIDLRSPLTVRNPYLTIAGQTAPAGGITLRKHPSLERASFNMLLFPRGRDGGKAHDVIIRYIRVRSGACPTCGDRTGVGSGALRSGISIVRGHDIILDHLSANWNTEDQIGISVPEYADADVHNFTLQRSLVAEPFRNHGTGVNIQSRYENRNAKKYFSIHHNLLSTINYRAPNVNMLGAAVINNVIYNTRVGAETRRHTTADFVNNYFKQGPIRTFMLHRHIQVASKYRNTPKSSSIYWEGNVVDGSRNATAGDWSILQFKEGEGAEYDSYPHLPSSWRRTSRLSSAPFPVRTQSASAAYSSVLEDVGAIARVDCRGNWVENRDAVEARLLREAASGTGGAVRDHQSQYGGYPSIRAGSACADRDSDGMPDEFENLHKLNTNDPADAALDRNGDGYTNLEAYLNGSPRP